MPQPSKDGRLSAVDQDKVIRVNGREFQIGFDSMGRVTSVVGAGVSARVWWNETAGSRTPAAVSIEQFDTGDKQVVSIPSGIVANATDRQKALSSDGEDDPMNRPEFWEPIIEFALYSNMNDWAWDPNSRPKPCDQ